MGLTDLFKSDHEDYHNKASLTHEALGGAVAYEIAKAYESHQAKNGTPPSHAKAKEIIAGLAGVALTHVLETKGADAWDEHQKKKAREEAEKRVAEQLSGQY